MRDWHWKRTSLRGSRCSKDTGRKGKTLRIYVERENHREGIWMELPASKEEAEKVRKELEKQHPSIMMPFVAAVESRFPEIERGLTGELVFQGNNLETFNQLAISLDGLSREDGLLFQAAYRMEASQSAEQILETVKHLDSYCLHPEIRSLEEQGRYLKRGEAAQLPEELHSICMEKRLPMDLFWVRRKRTGWAADIPFCMG